MDDFEYTFEDLEARTKPLKATIKRLEEALRVAGVTFGMILLDTTDSGILRELAEGGRASCRAALR